MADASKAKPKKPAKSGATTASADWREQTLARMRSLVLEADPELVEERKWKKPSNGMAGVPVWSRDGIVCTGETYAKVVKLTFARGAELPDPAGLFNASLDGNARRAIDIGEGEAVDPAAFKALVRAAVALNGQAKDAKPAKAAKTAKGAMPAKPAKASAARAADGGKKVVLLTGGNPQIAKGDGDAPVRAYVDAVPGWKGDLCARIDALIAKAVPGVQKAVKWNSPFYGVDGQGWFLSFHVFTRYVKVTFFKGTSLKPIPPGGTEKSKDARWIDIYEGDRLDEAQMAAWVKQAAAVPGWMS
ncbi:MAG TPA: DUF1801 domain-containing protein [Humisphaera sp.]